MFFADRLTLDKPKRTKDGFLAVRARAARVGVYDYSGREVDPDNKHGLRDEASVKVLRDEQTVFDEAAARSFVGKPITDDHPAEAVTSKNWRDHARGTVMGALRDGDYLAFDLLLTDADAIAKVDGGKRELSNGYSTDLEFGDFTAADGTKCQARQTAIAGNHVALVDKGRAGSSCAITDGLPLCDAITATELDRLKASLTDAKENAMKIKIGDAEVDATNGEAVRIAVDALNTKLTATDKRAADAEAKVVEHTATITARDAKIAELEQSLKDAEITPAKLADAAKEFADVQAKAKAVGVTVAADADAAAIKKAVVDAKMGDAAKDYSAEHIAIAFDALTKDADAKPAVPNGIARPLATDGAAGITTARAQWLADKQTAYRGQAAN